MKIITTGTKIDTWSMKQESKSRDNASTYGQLIYYGEARIYNGEEQSLN